MSGVLAGNLILAASLNFLTQAIQIGAYAARYAGEQASDEENLAKLLREAPTGSQLRYVCALALVDPADGRSQMFFGECRGRLAERVSGSGGFGYDPAFLPDHGDYGNRTMAELSDAEKDRISHRGNAVHSLVDWIRDAS